MSNQTNSQKDLSAKVYDWLSLEGYPLEFMAASVLQNHRFHTRRGEYVRSPEGDAAREIDVLASHSDYSNHHIFRVYQVVECKWSRDRPWVVFTGEQGRMAESACAAQTISSSYGSAIMWAIAGNSNIRSLQLFNSPLRPGFSGREALSKSQDRFYNSMKSVTDLSTLLVKEYDGEPAPKGGPPHNCVVAFPVLLVEGSLFEAHYCDTHRPEIVTDSLEVQ